MPNNMKVTLDKSTTPWSVDVDDKGGENKVDRSKKPQDVVWELSGNAAQGAFESLDGDKPGFEWVGTAPDKKIFSDPWRTDNDKKLKIKDTNENTGDPKEYPYVLRIKLDNKVYSTITEKGPILTNTNPVIINK
jgi:hypothetical protein